MDVGGALYSIPLTLSVGVFGFVQCGHFIFAIILSLSRLLMSC
jgi:hypothetical protein